MKIVKRGFGIFAVLFGVATVISGARVLFSGPEVYTAAGNVIPFVLWFNFLAGFFYVLAGGAIVFNRRMGEYLAYGIASLSILIYLAFWVVIIGGTPYEMRTAVAMGIRTGFWVIGSLLLLILPDGSASMLYVREKR